MPAIIKTAYGASASTGKANSAQGELSFAASNDTLWIGKGSNTQVAIGGPGKFTTLDTNQTISGTKTFTNTISGSISGNAATASTWATSRNITIGNSTQGVNGGANVTYTLAEIGAVSLSLNSAQIYVGSGLNTAAPVSLSGDATLSNSGVLTIANDAVSFAKIQNIGSTNNYSILGRTSLTSGDIGEITLSNHSGSNGYVLRRNDIDEPALGFGQIITSSISNNSVTVAKIEDVAGRGILGRNATTAGDLSEISASAAGQFLQSTSTGLAWSGTVDGTSSTIKLNGNDSASAAIPVNSDLEFTELYYISTSNTLYGVRGNTTAGLGNSNLVLLTGGTDIVMYSDAAPEAEDTYLILFATKKMSLTRVRYLLGAGTCTDAKLKRTSSGTTNDIVTFSVSTTEGTTTSLNSTYKEIGVGDKLLFNPGTLSSGTTPEDLTIQIEYVAGSEGSN